MYLKSIEVQGFKSFAKKTVFVFAQGITGIVGPNGSGKSNVADAVRWVLGEQSAKQLRGGSMQDVIFAGTQTRKPLGYASVSITLDNSDHVLPVSYDEVTVTRRLYRSGESEYLINGTACRLRDVNELFYDTGIGREGYSIIGQGQVDQILSGKPEDRRELFDEAAGIVKFKRRKAEAQKKLENEQANLLRVNDILAELTRQLGPLERASEKAKIYLKKKEQLKSYDVNLFLTEMTQLKDRLSAAEKDYANASEELSSVQAQTQQIRERYEAETAALDELQKHQNDLTDRSSRARLEKSDMEHRISLLEEQIAAAERSVKEKETRAANISADIRARQDDLTHVTSSAADMETQEKQLISQGGELETKQKALQEQLRSLNDQADQVHEDQIRLLGQRTSIRAEHQKYETMLEELQIRRAKLNSQILSLRTQETAKDDQIGQLREERKNLDGQIQTLTDRSSSLGEELSAVQERLTKDNQQFETDQAAYNRDVSRLESLRGIVERYEGYGNSVRRIMELKGKEKGLHGVVADLISTRKRYETAIEIALGGSIQNIVTDDEQTARRMIAYLKENRYGRATFLPLTAMNRPEHFTQTGALNEPGVIGLAKTLVNVQPQYAGLASHLLGRTLVCDQIDQAIALQKKYKYSLRIVTLDGELLSPGGSMTGGTFRNSSNLLGRRREVEELETGTKKQAKALQTLRSSIDQNRSKRNDLRDQIRLLGEQLQQLYLQKNTADMKAQQMESDRSQTRSDRKRMQQENAQALEQAKDLDLEREDVSKKLRESEETEQALKEKEDALRAQISQLSEEGAGLSAQIADARVAISGAQQKKTYLQAEAQRLSKELEGLKQEQSTLHEDRDEAGAQAKEKSARIEQIRAQIAQTDAQIQACEEENGKLAQEKDAIRSRQKTFFDQREELAQRSSLLDKECFRLNAQIEKLRETRENRIAYMWDEYELTYNNAMSLKRDDLGSQSTWKKNMASLRKEIRDLGNVNVNAIEEYKEVSQRHDFLSGQQEDLIRAEKALEKIISQLDQGMRTQFKEQFARIAIEFDRAFKQLFGGGSGTLELVPDQDVLEAGIRIIAQPPGKKLQNMSALSGGEKALTAIALLFAIQNLKPSPFCLLDEIEAALDENNVQRYAEYLRKLTKHTQFIIITHRRGTMAAADRLYGVTMQEKGVSALVSVSLIEDQLDE